MTPVPAPHPLAYVAHRLPVARGVVFNAQPLEWDFLRYSVVADTTLMSTEFGFTPTYDTETILSLISQRWPLTVDGAGLSASASSTEEASNA